MLPESVARAARPATTPKIIRRQCMQHVNRLYIAFDWILIDCHLSRDAFGGIEYGQPSRPTRRLTVTIDRHMPRVGTMESTLCMSWLWQTVSSRRL